MSEEERVKVAKALALLLLGFTPRSGESLDEFVCRCESELRRRRATGEEYARSGA